MDRLQTLLDTDSLHFNHVASVVGGLVGVGAGVILYKRLTRKKPQRGDDPPNTAIIYQFKAGPSAPSMSPFPMKLMTYCRLAKIPYEARAGRNSSKGKLPWMTYNKDTVADSQFCIDYFNKKLGVDLNNHLNDNQRGISKLIQVLADEHLYWGMVYFRWIHRNNYFEDILNNHFGFPRILIGLVRRTVRNQLHGQGMGRHSPDEIRQIIMDDLQALSDILGSKSFMLGEIMCEGDCSAFGMLCQFVWCQEDEVLKNILKDNFPNLHNYCLRVRSKVWPDWADCCK